MTLAGAVVAAVPGAATALEYRWEPVAAGDLWRPFTGQLTHWSVRMAILDLGALLLLGAWLEMSAPRLARWTMLAGSGAVALALPLVMAPGAAYRGASGIATALMVALALHLACGGSSPLARAVAWAALVLLAAKIAAEILTGRALAAGPLPAGVSVVPQVHLVGGAVAAATFWLLGRGRPGKGLTAPPGTPP